MTAQRDVLTTIPGKPGRFWGDHTTLVTTPTPRWLSCLLGPAWAHHLTGVVTGLRLFLRRGRYRGVVTDSGWGGLTFAWLQGLCPWGCKPHALVDCLWYHDASRWRHWFRALRLRLAARSGTRFVVWASHEAADYVRAFGLPPASLEYVPFHFTLTDYEYEIRDDGYLFAGGNSDRDYRMLIEAVRDLDVPTWIASTRSELFAGTDMPPHVRVEATTAPGFRQAMAAARLIVVPMQGGLLRSGGQQTLLNAMVMGKPTIAVGRNWATDYIRDGVNGLIVEYGDQAGLRRAVRWVLEYPEAARRMGERARAQASHFTTQRTMESVYRLVLDREPLPPIPPPEGETASWDQLPQSAPLLPSGPSS